MAVSVLAIRLRIFKLVTSNSNLSLFLKDLVSVTLLTVYEFKHISLFVGIHVTIVKDALLSL